MLVAVPVSAVQVKVRHKEGLVHGFLTLSTPDGTVLADGDLIQNAQGDRVTSRLVFHFKDGSLHDETAVFSQAGSFRLITDHLVQKGPAFAHPMEMTIEARSGKVTVQYTEDGQEKTASERMPLPADIANGLLLTLVKNVDPRSPLTKVSFVVATPKPRLIHFAIAPQGEEAFITGGAHRKAVNFDVKAEIGGITGFIASVAGKEPPDVHIWILEGEAPAFVKSEGPLAFGSLVWRIELVSPTWPEAGSQGSKEKK